MLVRCLLVDDSREFLRAASDLLDGNGVTVVGVVSSGPQARQACRELLPDVVVVDIHLGTESGFDVARGLVGLAGPGRPRVIFISASGADEFEDMVAAIPGASFLPKAYLSAAAIRGSYAGQRDSR